MTTETVIVPAVPSGPMPQAWRACVGTGRLNLALRSDYRDSLARVQREIGFGHIRGHGLLHDDLGIHRTDLVDGRTWTRYGFTYLDQVHDMFLDLGIRPFVELGFMPSALASGDDTIFWWKGNITPPADEGEWAALVRGVARHLVERYGIDEVRRWPFEVWNEPNLPIFWKDADQQAYFRLYEITARAVKDVDAGLLVGGPALSPGADEWWAPFAEFVTRRDVPVDFVSRHAYTSGPEQRVPFGTYQELRPPQNLLEQFAAPRERLAGTALAGLPVHITEFNSSYRPDNPVHDTAYHAAYLAPVLAAGGDLVDSFSYWTFCDVFEELGIPTSIFHGGFGLLTHRQLAKPTYHLFSFMARMGDRVLARGDDHLVCRDASGRVTVLAWHPVHGTDGADGGDRHEVALSLPVGTPDGLGAGGADGTGGVDGAGGVDGGCPRAVFVLRERVNEEDGNAFAAWRELGRPSSPDRRQLEFLRRCAEPTREHRRMRVSEDGRVTLRLPLARHEITFVELVGVRESMHEGLDDRRLLGRDDPRLVAAHERGTGASRPCTGN